MLSQEQWGGQGSWNRVRGRRQVVGSRSGNQGQMFRSLIISVLNLSRQGASGSSEQKMNTTCHHSGYRVARRLQRSKGWSWEHRWGNCGYIQKRDKGGQSQHHEWKRNIWILETVKVETTAAANRLGGERRKRRGSRGWRRREADGNVPRKDGLAVYWYREAAGPGGGWG